MRVELHACATLEGPLSHFRKCESESSQGKRIGMSLQPCVAAGCRFGLAWRDVARKDAGEAERDLRARRDDLPNPVECAREAW